MLRTVSDLITEVLVRNNRTTTDGFITDLMLREWLRNSNNYATTLYKWPLSEVRDKSIAWTGAEEIPYTDLTIDYKADSIRILQIGGKKLRKTTFEDYQDFRELYPSGTDRIYADYGRTLFINPIADVSGTIAAFGQYTPQIDPTDATATTMFSTFDEEGNEAIVERMTGYLKAREHLLDEQELFNQKCNTTLAGLWKKVQDEQFNYQPGPVSDGMFKRFDAVDGGFRDDINTNRF